MLSVIDLYTLTYNTIIAFHLVMKIISLAYSEDFWGKVKTCFMRTAKEATKDGCFT